MTVEVFAPKEIDGKKFTFRSNLKVGTAAHEAAVAFGYPKDTKATFKHGKKVLDADKTLEESHVHDGEKLELVDTGGGV
ncbi:MAG: hypothetical protein ACRELY_10645 [Polyangiaceae bacterium]